MSRYFDHTASRAIPADLLAFYCEALERYPGNPASLHEAGLEAKRAIDSALERLADALGAAPDEIILSSGGSESINTAIKGLARRKSSQAKRYLSTAGEHAASRQSLEEVAKEQQAAVLHLPLEQGQLSLTALDEALDEKADFLTCIHVNNETGAVLPLEAMQSIIKAKAPRLPIHLDAVQALGKLPFHFHALNVSYASLSLHKIGAPKGLGILLHRGQWQLPALLHGGGQQKQRRAGTQSAPDALVAAQAVEAAVKEQAALAAHAQACRQQFLGRLQASQRRYHVFAGALQVPHILSVQFPGLRAQSLLNVLRPLGFALSLGSACGSKDSQGSPVLRAMGASPEAAMETLRISFGLENQLTDVDDLAEAILAALARYQLA